MSSRRRRPDIGAGGSSGSVVTGLALYTISGDDLQTLMLACLRLAVNVAGLLAHEERRYLYWLRISP